MKSLITLFAAAALTACTVLAGCQSSDNRGNDNGQPPSSVGNGQTRNNGPFAPDSHPRLATNPSN